jgi:AraC family ethanolamine operon transcriptional activator
MRYLKTRSIVVYLESLAAPIRFRGLSPPGMLAFSVPVRTDPDTRYFRTVQDDSGLPMMMPGVFEGVLGTAHSHFIVLVDLGRLKRQFPDETFQSLLNACAARKLPASAEQIANFRDWLWRVLRTAFAHPAMLSSEPAMRSLEEDLLLRLAALAEPPYRPLGKCATASRGLRRALEQLHAMEPQVVNIPDLCRDIQFSQRSLTRAFRQTFDLTPTQYLRLRRLYAVRRCLLQSRKGETTVAAIALEHGFYELGRFAASYAAQFGEPPSTTLSRADSASIRSLLI